MTDFYSTMYFLLGVILIVRFVNSFESKNGRTYSARTLLLNFTTLMIYICSIPCIWK